MLLPQHSKSELSNTLNAYNAPVLLLSEVLLNKLNLRPALRSNKAAMKHVQLQTKQSCHMQEVVPHDGLTYS